MLCGARVGHHHRVPCAMYHVPRVNHHASARPYLERRSVRKRIDRLARLDPRRGEERRGEKDDGVGVGVLERGSNESKASSSRSALRCDMQFISPLLKHPVDLFAELGKSGLSSRIASAVNAQIFAEIGPGLLGRRLRLCMWCVGGLRRA